MILGPLERGHLGVAQSDVEVRDPAEERAVAGGAHHHERVPADGDVGPHADAQPGVDHRLARAGHLVSGGQRLLRRARSRPAPRPG